MRKVLVFAAVLALFTLPVAAEKATTDAAKQAAPEMSAEDKAAMETCIKAGTPGAQHAALEPMAGTFDASVTMWMKPGAEPSTSPGSSDGKWIYAGRYLEQHFSGDMGGMPFEGRGYTGYDNVQGKYVGTWIDSMSTGIMTSTGKSTGDGKFEFTGKYWDPMTTKETTTRQELTIKSANEHVFYMYGPGPDGKEFKMMEIAYKRKPSTAAAIEGK